MVTTQYSASFTILSLGSHPFLRKGNRLPHDASYNDPTLGIYVIVIGMINKNTHFLRLQIYT